MFYTEQASLTEVYEISDRVSKIPGVARFHQDIDAIEILMKSMRLRLKFYRK